MRTSRVAYAALFSRCLPLYQSNESAPPKQPSAADYKRLQEELKEVTQAVEAAKTQCLYSAAAADNTRKETDASIKAAQVNAKEEFAKDMLDAADALEKTAKQAQLSPEENASLTPPVRSLLGGVQLSFQVLGKVLKRHGVEKMSVTVGTKFDPETQVAIFKCPTTAEVPEGHVAEVVKDGYLYNGKVMRQAHVGVTESA